MEVYCTGIAQIKHASTGVIYEITSDELEWDAVDGDEGQMGPEIHYEATIERSELGELTWGVWEYPLGCENYSDTEAGDHEVISDFDYGLEHVADSDEWVDYPAPNDPFSIFMNSYHHAGFLLADYGSDSGSQLLNRMIFTQQITAMEAYLADKLINEIEADADAFQHLVAKDDELAKEKFTLAEIAKDPTLVKQKVHKYLRSIQFHNLAKVDALYSIALGIRILNHTKERDRLFKAVILRHDCVHRNGFDKDSNEITVFTKVFVQETADLVKEFVQELENAVEQRPKKEA